MHSRSCGRSVKTRSSSTPAGAASHSRDTALRSERRLFRPGAGSPAGKGHPPDGLGRHSDRYGVRLRVGLWRRSAGRSPTQDAAAYAAKRVAPRIAGSRRPGGLAVMTSSHSLIQRLPRLRRASSGQSVVPRRTLSLYLRVVSVNAAILLVAVSVLVLTPAGVSSQTTAEEGIILVGVLAVMLVANALLLRVTFSGLTALVRRMETLDVLQAPERLPQMGGEETCTLITGFNAMLDRLEQERLASARRMVTTLEGERQRIGQELHDEIGQRLTGMLLQLGRIRVEAPDSLMARIAGVQNEARATLDEVGALAWQVRPGVLDDLGLVSGLEALGDSLEEHGSARIETALPDRLARMSSEVELAVYRIAQEALTNAVRHSGATAIRLELRRTRQDLVLQVTDNGCGLSGPGHEGPGVRGMRERALLIGGRLRLHAQAPGLRVRLAIPACLLG